LSLALVAVAAIGCQSLRSEQLRPSLGELADRAKAQAEKLAGDGAARRPGDTGRTPKQEPPPGYVVMTAKAQLDALHGNALLLVDESEERVVPIFVGNTEALSIKLRMDGERYKRPLTHDLLDNLLRRLDASFVRAQVDELRDNTYIGSVVVRAGDAKLIEIDARPSDAIALAIGNGAPIFMAQKVLDKAGHRIDDLERDSAVPGAAGEPTVADQPL
jgi:bifunctional DNase/RNase